MNLPSVTYRRTEGSTVVKAIETPSAPVQELWDELSRVLGTHYANTVVDLLSRVDGNWTIRGLIFHWRAGTLR